MNLIEACYNDNLEEAKRLLSEGADVNAMTDAPLRISCIRNNLEIVKLLVLYGADVKHAIKLSNMWDNTKITDYLVKQMLIEKLNDITDSN